MSPNFLFTCHAAVKMVLFKYFNNNKNHYLKILHLKEPLCTLIITNIMRYGNKGFKLLVTCDMSRPQTQIKKFPAA